MFKVISILIVMMALTIGCSKNPVESHPIGNDSTVVIDTVIIVDPPDDPPAERTCDEYRGIQMVKDHIKDITYIMNLHGQSSSVTCTSAVTYNGGKTFTLKGDVSIHNYPEMISRVSRYAWKAYIKCYNGNWNLESYKIYF